jgi:coenzyme F420 hydrogenase subunit beta
MGIWNRFLDEVVEPGNCTHCGACVGLNPGVLEFRETTRGPLPIPIGNPPDDTAELASAWAVCSGRGVPFPQLFRHLGVESPNTLAGPVTQSFTGYASDPVIRRTGASGGAISRVLIHLVESGRVSGAVVLQQGRTVPDIAEPFIATSREEILAAAQSVYAVTPMLTILDQMADFDGNLAFVGLPEQVATLRMLQAAGNPAALKVTFVAGPYTGTNMYRGAVRAFLRSHGVGKDVPIESLKWRAGEWPGYLEVRAGGEVYRAAKFYYNYLIPFYISRNCQITPDFTNELTDMSVGDAWSPAFEKERGGHSVILARNEKARDLLVEVRDAGDMVLDEVNLTQALSMHGHMLDFKKRGSFIRLDIQERGGKPVPRFGYRPRDIAQSRRMIERIIGLFFSVGRMRIARWTVERLPLKLVGTLFDVMRRSWKSASKPAKRKGLRELDMIDVPTEDRWQEVLNVMENRA